MAALIELQHVSKVYEGGEQVRALDDVSLTIDDGEFVAVIGQSGSGKSTLMNILGCLDVPTKGRYLLGGRDMSRVSSAVGAAVRSRQIGFIFQGFHLIPSLTAEENVELPLIYRGMPEKKRRRLAEENLRLVGLADRMEHRPSQLSGGQQQRVAIARALAGDPPMLLADEPTGNLDTAAGREIMSLLHRLHEDGTTVIIITHDPEIGAACPRRVVMEDGHLREG